MPPAYCTFTWVGITRDHPSRSACSRCCCHMDFVCASACRPTNNNSPSKPPRNNILIKYLLLLIAMRVNRKVQEIPFLDTRCLIVEYTILVQISHPIVMSMSMQAEQQVGKLTCHLMHPIRFPTKQLFGLRRCMHHNHRSISLLRKTSQLLGHKSEVRHRLLIIIFQRIAIHADKAHSACRECKMSRAKEFFKHQLAGS